LEVFAVQLFNENLKSPHNSRLPPGGLLRPPVPRLEIHFFADNDPPPDAAIVLPVKTDLKNVETIIGGCA